MHLGTRQRQGRSSPERRYGGRGESKPHVGRSLKLHAVTLSDLKGHSMKNSFKKCQELPQGPSHREDPRTPDKSLCFSPFSFLGIIPESTF